MAKKQNEEETLAWLRKHPELLEKLERMRQMEADCGEADFDRIELEMLELVKAMGASSLGRCVQGKEAAAIEAVKAKGACRLHGKKN